MIKYIGMGERTTVGEGEVTERRARALRSYAIQLGVDPDDVIGVLEARFGSRMASAAFAAGEQVWGDDTLSPRERSLIVLAALITQGGAESRMRGHVRLALANGAKPEELEATIATVGVYAGFPRASAAIELVADELARAGSPIAGVESPSERGPDRPTGRVRRLLGLGPRSRR
jgi:4-carboxymuconolactone decarboxylase